MRLTLEQRAALCEYVDGRRGAGASYESILEGLEGKVSDEVLEQLEGWHRAWKKGEWRKEAKRLSREVDLGDTDVADVGCGGGECEVRVPWDGEEAVRYLAQRLLSAEMLESGRVRWRPLYTRALMDGQACERVKGPGMAGGVRWLVSAVIFRTGETVDHVEPEARIRQRIRPGSATAERWRTHREMIKLERLELVAERLDLSVCASKLAALLQTFLGSGCGIRSGAHLAKLTGVTRQAVSARKLGIAEEYYEKTGGKAGFEGMHGRRKKLKS